MNHHVDGKSAYIAFMPQREYGHLSPLRIRNTPQSETNLKTEKHIDRRHFPTKESRALGVVSFQGFELA